MHSMIVLRGSLVSLARWNPQLMLTSHVIQSTWFDDRFWSFKSYSLKSICNWWSSYSDSSKLMIACFIFSDLFSNVHRWILMMETKLISRQWPNICDSCDCFCQQHGEILSLEISMPCIKVVSSFSGFVFFFLTSSFHFLLSLPCQMLSL